MMDYGDKASDYNGFNVPVIARTHFQAQTMMAMAWELRHMEATVYVTYLPFIYSSSASELQALELEITLHISPSYLNGTSNTTSYACAL